MFSGFCTPKSNSRWLHFPLFYPQHSIRWTNSYVFVFQKFEKYFIFPVENKAGALWSWENRSLCLCVIHDCVWVLFFWSSAVSSLRSKNTISDDSSDLCDLFLEFFGLVWMYTPKWIKFFLLEVVEKECIFDVKKERKLFVRKLIFK